MRKIILLSLAIISMLSSGCATYANGSAKAPKEGDIYIVGSEGSKAKAWLCRGSDNNCSEVNVNH